MKCPNCGFEQPDNSETCPACGLIFSKWRARHSQSPAASSINPCLDQPSTVSSAETPVVPPDSSAPLSLELKPKKNFRKNPFYYAAILTAVLAISAVAGWLYSTRSFKTVVQPPVGSGQYVNTTVGGTATPGGDQQNSASAFAADTFFSDPTDTPEDSTATPTETPQAPSATSTATQTLANSQPSPGQFGPKVEAIFATPSSSPTSTSLPNTPTPTVVKPTPTVTTIGVSVPSFHY